MTPFMTKMLLAARTTPPVCYCTPQTWSLQALTITGLSDIRYCDTLFIALTSAATNPNFSTSTDGASWTSQFLAMTPIDVWYDGSKYVMIGMNSGGTLGQVSTSADGATWGTVTSMGSVTSAITCGAFGGGVHVAIGNGVLLTSTDGINWTSRSATNIPATPRSVTYGGGRFVCVGGSSGTGTASYSTDGINWVASTGVPAGSFTRVCYGNNLFVAVNINGTDRVMTSTNGVAWTARTAAEANAWQGIIYGNGLYVAVASGGTNRVMTSTDAITWSTASAAAAQSWQDVAYGNKTFCAVSSNGTNRAMTSPCGCP